MNRNELKNLDRKLIAVDFDKTLTDPPPEESIWKPAHKQEPDTEMVEAVTEAYHSGHIINIWTARKWPEAAKIHGWLTVHEVPYHGLRCDKGSADTYIDDRTITPEEFLGNESVMRVETG